jgi:hypothetical protein
LYVRTNAGKNRLLNNHKFYKVLNSIGDHLDVGDGAKNFSILWQKRTQKHNFVFVLPYNSKMNKRLIFTNKFYNLDY